MKNENPATCAKRAMREGAALRRKLSNGKLYIYIFKKLIAIG